MTGSVSGQGWARSPSAAARTTTVRMILAVVATGVGAGVIGILVTWLLKLIQDLAFGAGGGSFVAQVESASPIRRVAALAVGGAVTGIGWWLLRRPPAPLVSVDEAVADPRRRLPPLRTALDACLQVAAVAAGGSLGREGAPRQAGAALGGWFAERTGLDDTRRRTLLACGAGAGLAAVYDVPLGGAVFALEVLLASTALADVLAAAATSAIATAVAWVGIGAHQTYLVAVPTAGGASGVVVVGGSLLVFAVLLGPVAGAVGAAFLRLTTFARAHAATGWRVPVAMTGVFAALGLLAWPFPELLGNGHAPTQLVLDGAVGVGVLVAVTVLKPVVTAACLGSGAVGGLLTPSLSTGAALGAVTGIAWSRVWPADARTAFVLIGAAAVLAATQRAPVTAVVLVLEFTQTGLTLLVPMVLAVVGSVLTAGVLTARRSRDPEGMRRD